MKSLFIAITILLTLPACKKDSLDCLDCGNLRQGLITNNISLVSNEVNKLTSTLEPHITASDPVGHKQNVEKLAEMLSSHCNVIATVFCYNCIKTLPEQSEITISVMSSGTVIQKTIDISYNENNRLFFVNMHE